VRESRSRRDGVLNPRTRPRQGKTWEATASRADERRPGCSLTTCPPRRPAGERKPLEVFTPGVFGSPRPLTGAEQPIRIHLALKTGVERCASGPRVGLALRMQAPRAHTGSSGPTGPWLTASRAGRSVSTPARAEGGWTAVAVHRPDTNRDCRRNARYHTSGVVQSSKYYM
jgi:hypothetical protein